jgi:beta-barrel assembly-enhancing protease
MKCVLRISVLGIVLLSWSLPVEAQLGQIQRGVKRVQQIQDIHISDAEEQKLGEMVSQRIRQRFGVVQDPEVHRYVTLVGTLVAEASARPNLPWRFIVLDTDAVNAFAAPGGVVHITRGALALMEDEAELAGVLGHEVGHVASKHTIEAIQKNRMIQMGADEALSNRGLFLDQLAHRTYELVIENSFDRDDELSADRNGVLMANQAGYAPDGLAIFLTRLAERNQGATERRGLFASHPEMKERLDRIARQIAAEKLAATARVAARFEAHVVYEPVPQAAIALVELGAAGLAGGGTNDSSKAAEEEVKPEEKEPEPRRRRGFGIARLTQPAGSERQSAQVMGSGGARGVDPDRDATGGPNPAVVRVTVTAADLAEFRKALAEEGAG